MDFWDIISHTDVFKDDLPSRKKKSLRNPS